MDKSLTEPRQAWYPYRAMKRVAVIGAGISGLAVAHFLSRRCRVDLFEKDSRLGGHTNTVVVEGAGGAVALDTGFLVHNDRTYPNLVRLFGELGVTTRDSDMSFAVSCRRSGLEYSSRGANGFFAAFFALCFLVQLVQGIRYKTWTFMIALCLGCLGEAVGYGGRIMM